MAPAMTCCDALEAMGKMAAMSVVASPFVGALHDGFAVSAQALPLGAIAGGDRGVMNYGKTHLNAWEPDLRVGIIACLRTHGSLANWHPHLHLVVTDDGGGGGGFRTDGTFVRWPGGPAYYSAALSEAFRRAVLAGTPPQPPPWPGRVGPARRPGYTAAAGRSEVARRRSRSLGRHGASVERASIDSAPAQRYDVGSSSRIVRTERSPSPPARVVGDPAGYRPGTIRDTGGKPSALPWSLVAAAPAPRSAIPERRRKRRDTHARR